MASFLGTYGLQARIQPALLALLPVFFTAVVWVPELYDWAVGLIGLATACGVLVVLSHISRLLGRQVQPKLYANWGGKPTTRWLFHSDGNLDPETKTRYHAFLTQRVRNWVAPSPEEEPRDPKTAEVAYESAVRWLQEQSGNSPRHSLVFKENVSYGFRRNLFGLKPIGLTVAGACAVYNATLKAGQQLPTVGIASLLLSILAVALWLGIVRDGWVRDAADGYARALLAVCDQLAPEESLSNHGI